MGNRKAVQFLIIFSINCIARRSHLTLKKHGNHWHRYTSCPLFNTPSIYKHASRNYSTHEWKWASKSIFRHPESSLSDPLFDCVVGPATSHERSDQISSSGN